MASFKHEVKKNIKPLINVGACLDLPSGNLLQGQRGEVFYNAGIGITVGITGRGNSFKSSIAHFLTLTAAGRMHEGSPTQLSTYDTENSADVKRLEYFASKYAPSLGEYPISREDPNWFVVESAITPGETWIAEITQYSEEKKKDKSELVTFQPFLDFYTKKPLVDYNPTFVEIDSLSAMSFDTLTSVLLEGVEKSDSNVISMKAAGLKSRFFQLLPSLAYRSNIFFIITMHLGYDSSPKDKYAPVKKQLNLLKGDEKIKGIPENATFFLFQTYKVTSCADLTNASTKKEEYPKAGVVYPDKDLYLVTVSTIRGKSGPSAGDVSLVVSQQEGVLPTLTEFHYIKTRNRYGLEGSDRRYNLSLYPELSLERTKIRGYIDSDPLLRRAINITSEMLQLELYHNNQLRATYGEDIFCTPKELYEDIKKLGYDWKELLKTRGYWTINQYTHPVPFLSTVDLLRMRKGLYVPYFLKNNKKEN